MKVSKVPVLVEKKENCCGCAACEAICPQDAIQMKLDEDGFYYPQIQRDKCIGCGRCMQVCHLN